MFHNSDYTFKQKLPLKTPQPSSQKMRRVTEHLSVISLMVLLQIYKNGWVFGGCLGEIPDNLLRYATQISGMTAVVASQ